MTALGPAAQKLGKLIPRLGSGSDGEVLATVHAIVATLRRSGLDLHDLAAAIQPTEPSARGLQAEEVVAFCLSEGQSFTAREQEFLHSLVRAAQTRGPLELSSKQWDWLLDIAAKVERCDA